MSISRSRPKTTTKCTYSLVSVAALAFGLAANVGVEAAEKAYDLNMDIDDIVTTSDLATAIVTCITLAIFFHKLEKHDENLNLTLTPRYRSIQNSDVAVPSLRSSFFYNDSESKLKRYSIETAKIVLAIGLGLAIGIGTDRLEKKYDLDINLSYITLSDIATAVMSILGYGLTKTFLNMFCNSRRIDDEEDPLSEEFEFDFN